MNYPRLALGGWEKAPFLSAVSAGGRLVLAEETWPASAVADVWLGLAETGGQHHQHQRGSLWVGRKKRQSSSASARIFGCDRL